MTKNIIVGRNLLETLTSALYEDPIVLFREYVQNSLDAYNLATRNDSSLSSHSLEVTIDIDKEKKIIIIKDNGFGISSADNFQKAMLGFGNSEKKDRSRFIGFRGIGRLSGLPFCKTLRFRNKIIGTSKIDICTWQGERYRELLNTNDETTFQEIVNAIVDIKQEEGNDPESHYFEVEIIGYGSELEDDVILNTNFEQRLRKMLPVKYDDSFPSAKLIEEQYRKFMNEELSDFMCSVVLDGTELRKAYTDVNNVLDSGLVFIPIKEKEGPNKKPGDKIGLLWFTFNKKPVAVKDDSCYGIMIRSKNVLMGDNDSFADLCTNSKRYVATYTELAATLRGVYGELLINSTVLRDNARREWFRTDEHSIFLKYVIVDFMSNLYAYRYAASKYFRARAEDKSEKKKQSLKIAIRSLLNVDENLLDVDDFCKKETKDSTREGNDNIEKPYSEEDIPRQNITKKRNYDEIMKVMEAFFIKEEKYELFLKLRAFVKKFFGKV